LLKSTLQFYQRDKELIRKAFDLTVETHSSQRRKNWQTLYLSVPLQKLLGSKKEIGLGTVL
jgi:adenosyl cobinamide kinase/adenosyl cobinamide phosphate guanylyltransferase